MKKQNIQLFHYLGNCKSISIDVKSDNAKISEVVLNKKVPFEVNVPRMIILICICLVFYSLKTAQFWKDIYSPRSFKQNLVLLLIVYFGIITIFFINKGCGNSDIKDLYNDNLVKALSKGNVVISNTPDTSKLDELNDPYDAIEREKLDRDTDYIWDAAYFNHKYYVYYGAVPAVLLMVPYYLITKKLMSSAITTLIFSILSVPVLVLLTKKVFQKFWKDLPFKYMAFSSLIMSIGTMLIWINVAPRFYELVTVAGFFFAILGFLLVFDSEKKTENENEVSYLKVFFGCLSLALAVGCRPTHFLTSLLILPILVRIFLQIMKEKKKLIILIVSVVVPYVVVAALIMRYNYLRFGNVFEFGERYQLTINNMNKLSLRWNLLPTGILCSLFGLPTFQGFFPFIHANGNLIDTFGYYYVEDMPGGVFFLVPIAFFCFGIFSVLKKSKEDKDYKSFVISLLLVGLIFVTFISLKAGSTGRYLLDFAWIFVLCGICIFMKIVQNLKTDEGRKILEKVLGVIVCYTLIINILLGFCSVGGNNFMRNNSPKQYFKSEYTIMILK